MQNNNTKNVLGQVLKYIDTYLELEPFMDREQKIDYLIKLMAVAEAEGATKEVNRLLSGIEERSLLERDSAAGVELL